MVQQTPIGGTCEQLIILSGIAKLWLCTRSIGGQMVVVNMGKATVVKAFGG